MSANGKSGKEEVESDMLNFQVLVFDCCEGGDFGPLDLQFTEPMDPDCQSVGLLRVWFARELSLTSTFCFWS